MGWQRLTIAHYQAVMKVLAAEGIDDLDKELEVCSILSGKTVAEIEAMNLGEYTDLKKGIDFVFGKPPTVKPRLWWKGFRFIYDIREVNVGRYISMKYFLQGDIVQNMHHLAAIITRPLWGRYRPELHEQYAERLKDAPYVAVYSSLVFFCKLYQAMSLEAAERVAKMHPEATELVNLLKSNLHGFTMWSDLPTTSDAAQTKP